MSFPSLRVHPAFLIVLFCAQASAVLGEPSGISLAEAERRALDANPAWAAARHAVEAAEGARRQAGAWPNPELEVEAEEFGGDRPGWDDAEVTWSLTQRVDLSGARGARARAARQERDAVRFAAESARRELLVEVRRRFTDALLSQERLRVLAADESLAAEAAGAVRALVDAGEASPIEVERAEAERALTSIRRGQEATQLRRTLRELAALWGGDAAPLSAVEGELETCLRDSLSVRPLEPMTSTPESQRAEAEVRAAEAKVAEAGRRRWPELQVRAGLKQIRGADEQSYVGGVGLALPLWDRESGARQEAKARLAAVRAGARAERIRSESARQDALDALQGAIETARTLRGRSLPRAEAVHAALREGYQRGKFALLDLIDARRQLLQSRLEDLDALHAVWLAQAELTRWMAGDPDRSTDSEEGGSR
jgi:cobalt-zinc-cadmium efflux system outer membrane protein